MTEETNIKEVMAQRLQLAKDVMGSFISYESFTETTQDAPKSLPYAKASRMFSGDLYKLEAYHLDENPKSVMVVLTKGEKHFGNFKLKVANA